MERKRRNTATTASDKFALSTARIPLPRITAKLILSSLQQVAASVSFRDNDFATFVKISKRICKFSMEFKRSGVEFAEINRGTCCETHDATNFPSTLTLSFSLSSLSVRATCYTSNFLPGRSNTRSQHNLARHRVLAKQ